MEEGKVDIEEICVLLGITNKINEVKNVIENCKSETLLKGISDVLRNLKISYDENGNGDQENERKYEMLNNFIEEAGIEKVTDVGFKDTNKGNESGMFLMLNNKKMVPIGKVMYTPTIEYKNGNWSNE
jgi:hypothetical protein